MEAASPVSAIPNLGPASESAFASAGITSAEQLRALGADEGYRRLLLSGQRGHFIGYYALVMGLQGRRWNDCTPAEKKELRVRYEALRSGLYASQGGGEGASKATAALDVALRQIGVI